LETRGVKVQPHLFGKKKKHKDKDNDKLILLQLLEQFCISKKEMMLFWFSEKTGDHWPWIEELLQFMKESCFCKTLKGDKKWVKLDLLSLFFINMETVTIVDCEINDAILMDIELFLQKLNIDPKAKYTQKESAKTEQNENDKNEQEEMDKLIGIDIDALVSDLHSEKSHISFKDPDFDDLCDYRKCKIKQIKILESYDQDNHQSIVTDKILKKWNRRFKKSGWEMVKGKIMGTNDGFIFRKSNITDN